MSSPLRKFKSPIQDFLATVLFFKPHIFPRDSLVAFDSYQAEKVRNSRIVNLNSYNYLGGFYVKCFARVMRFLQPWQESCNVVLTLC